MLDLNDIALFVQVTQASSFANAGRRLGIPANTISRRIQGLEEALGARLMQRSTRKLTLTDAGRRLYDSVVAPLQTVAESTQALIDGNHAPTGTFRVAAPASFFNFFKIQWVDEFLQRYPQVNIEFVLDDSRADLIAEGIDLAYRTGNDLDASLIARKIGTTYSALVASPSYINRQGAPEKLSQLATHNCLFKPTPSGQITWQFEQEKVTVSGRFRANTVQAILDATRAGLGIALLPSVIANPYLASGELQEVLPQYRINNLGNYFVYLTRKQLPLAVSMFIEFTMTKMRESHLLSLA